MSGVTSLDNQFWGENLVSEYFFLFNFLFIMSNVENYIFISQLLYNVDVIVQTNF
jgi:hypothetical protein